MLSVIFGYIYELPSQNKSLCYLLTYLPTQPSTYLHTYLDANAIINPFFYIRIYFRGISNLKLAKFYKYLKNKPRAEALKMI